MSPFDFNIIPPIKILLLEAERNHHNLVAYQQLLNILTCFHSRLFSCWYFYLFGFWWHFFFSQLSSYCVYTIQGSTFNFCQLIQTKNIYE